MGPWGPYKKKRLGNFCSDQDEVRIETSVSVMMSSKNIMFESMMTYSSVETVKRVATLAPLLRQGKTLLSSNVDLLEATGVSVETSGEDDLVELDLSSAVE